MAPAGNYSGSFSDKFLTVNFDLFSSLLPILYPKMGPIMEVFGTLFRGIQEA